MSIVLKRNLLEPVCSETAHFASDVVNGFFNQKTENTFKKSQGNAYDNLEYCSLLFQSHHTIFLN